MRTLAKLLVCFSVLGFTPLLNAADSYQIAASGGSQFIAEHGLCATITNTKSNALFVPTKTQTEWLAFLNSGQATVSYQGCSCYSLFKSGQTTSGIYSIDPSNSGSPINAYCDMTTNGGGWTLVGRSVTGASSVTFGWQQDTGSVSDDTVPYSLNVVTAGLKFSVAMFGDYSAGKTWGSYVYTRPFSSVDVVTFATSNTGITDPTPVVGGVTTATMLRRMGFTSTYNDHFFFRDITGGASTGLYHNRWRTVYANDSGGNLDASQGLIMVR